MRVSGQTLDKVIFKVRFPLILKVASELPVAFQEKLRDRFPLFSEKRESSRSVARWDREETTAASDAEVRGGI